MYAELIGNYKNQEIKSSQGNKLTIDEYGKMRTCEYFPVALIDFDKYGDVIEPECPLYNDVAYLKQLTYEGEINNEDVDKYTIIETHLTREQTYDSILKRLETLNNN